MKFFAQKQFQQLLVVAFKNELTIHIEWKVEALHKQEETKNAIFPSLIYYIF